MNLSRQEEGIWKMRHAYRFMENEDFNTIATGDNQNRFIASFVPDEIINNFQNFAPKSYEGSLMFVDIFGFTELFEKWNKTNQTGSSSLRLAQILNDYIGAMIHEIILYDGDVLKISSEEIIASWKQNETQTMDKAVHRAIDCALAIQTIYRSYHTSVDGMLKVRLAISTGTIDFSVIGDEQSAHFVIVGEPLWEIQFGGRLTGPGQIIVSPTAWSHINSKIYSALSLGIRGYSRILYREKEDRSNNLNDDSASSNFNPFPLRLSVYMAGRLNIYENLQKFLINPVKESIKMNVPLENLTEMRRVTIVFIDVRYDSSHSQKIIKLAKESYKLVCHYAKERNGCINKVSVSKVNMEFQLLFGLRGLKHELECQFALQCATKCHQTIQKLEFVTSVSIGIATGRIYCGVCGDTIRREYLVIGSAVTLAQYIITYHANKVTCDRETFVNSKLRTEQFTLLEMNGISQCGAIYEFHEDITSSRYEMQSISAYPLLGNQDVLTMYQQLFDNFLELPENSDTRIEKMLLIQGVARQGKSRLLQELIYVTPEEVPIYKFSLSENDNQIPFQSLRAIFSSRLGFSPEKTIERSLTPDLHYFANNIFGTHFDESTNWHLHQQSKEIIFREEFNFLKQICLEIFKNKSIIVIDNLEFIDKQSWEYFDVLVDSPNVLLLASVGYGKATDAKINRIFIDKRVKVTIMKAIDRWFHGALTCQLLNVYAISSELENAIQTNSNGNPGWIENFLVSLIDTGCLCIKKGNTRKMADAGLICPPLYTIKRLSPSEKDKWQRSMEDKHASFEPNKTDNDWRKFVDICTDNYTNIEVREQLHVKLKCPKVVPVCLVSLQSNCKKNVSNDVELSVDTVICRIFDALLPDEQLLLKCSATLGDQFSRDMLLYVLDVDSPRKAASAIKRLFDFRLLACAEGDFIDGTNIVTFPEFMSSENDKTPTCKCRLKKIHKTCQDFPTYASCGHMQFCNTRVREFVNNLLTNDETMKYHLRAIERLEAQPRKCRICSFDQTSNTSPDNDSYVQVAEEYDSISSSAAKSFIGHPVPSTSQQSHDLSMDTISLSTPTESSASISVLQRSKEYESVSLSSAESSINQRLPVPSTSEQSDDLSTVTISSTPTESSASANSDTKKFKSIWGFRRIAKLKNCNLRDFPNENFRDCECLPLLTATCSQLAAHYKSIGEWSKLLDVLLEYADASIRSSNLELALTILEEALDVLDITPRADLPCKSNLIRGKIYSLLGHAYLLLDQFDDAEIKLQMALEQYDRKLPYSKLSGKLKKSKLSLKQSFGLFVLPNRLTNKKLSHWKSYICNTVSQILSHFATLFMKRNQWEYAELAATWSLSKALKASNDFKILCTAYSNMLMVATHNKCTTQSVALEAYAMDLCNKQTQHMEQEELKAVIKLYTAMFWSTLAHADINKAKQIGNIALRAAISIRASELIVPILPTLMYCCLLTNDVDSAVRILNKLRLFAEDNYDQSGRLWYFAQCMAFHLETGYVVTPNDECEKFVEDLSNEDFINIKDKAARNHYFVTLWLWCVRSHKWDKAALLYSKIKEFYQIELNDSSLINQLTALYLLEGLIITLNYKIDGAGVQSCVDIGTEIDVLIKVLEISAKTTKIILPRLFHMKAYYCIVRYNDSKAFNFLLTAHKLTADYNLTLEGKWITHSLEAWRRTMETNIMEFWLEHCDKHNQLEYRRMKYSNRKIGFFTLPLPVHSSSQTK